MAVWSGEIPTLFKAFLLRHPYYFEKHTRQRGHSTGSANFLKLKQGGKVLNLFWNIFRIRPLSGKLENYLGVTLLIEAFIFMINLIKIKIFSEITQLIIIIYCLWTRTNNAIQLRSFDRLILQSFSSMSPHSDFRLTEMATCWLCFI